MLRHKINWNETLRRANTAFPVSFETITRVRQFDSPENILFMLCMMWINRESERLLGLDFVQPLSEQEKQIITRIRESSKNIIVNFPFQEILESTKKYSKLTPYNDRITDLESQSRFRIKKGLIRNKKYTDLLNWIAKFKELNIRIITRTKTTLTLETLKDLDTLYEIWIFFEFIDYLKYERRLPVKIKLQGKERSFEFKYSGNTISIHYEKEFNDDTFTWAGKPNPDFTVISNNSVIAVFDAKNYHRTSKLRPEATNKMLAYLAKLDARLWSFDFSRYA